MSELSDALERWMRAREAYHANRLVQVDLYEAMTKAEQEVIRLVERGVDE